MKMTKENKQQMKKRFAPGSYTTRCPQCDKLKTVPPTAGKVYCECGKRYIPRYHQDVNAGLIRHIEVNNDELPEYITTECPSCGHPLLTNCKRTTCSECYKQFDTQKTEIPKMERDDILVILFGDTYLILGGKSSSKNHKNIVAMISRLNEGKLSRRTVALDTSDKRKKASDMYDYLINKYRDYFIKNHKYADFRVRKISKIISTCPKCKHTETVTDRSDHICEKCRMYYKTAGSRPNIPTYKQIVDMSTSKREVAKETHSSNTIVRPLNRI